MGALLAYSLLQRVNMGGENQLSRMGHNFAARTGLDHLGDRMSSVHSEGIWLAGYIYFRSSKEDGRRPFQALGSRSFEENKPSQEQRDFAPELEETEHHRAQLRVLDT